MLRQNWLDIFIMLCSFLKQIRKFVSASGKGLMVYVVCMCALLYNQPVVLLNILVYIFYFAPCRPHDEGRLGQVQGWACVVWCRL